MSHVIGRSNGQDVKIPFFTRELRLAAAAIGTVAFLVLVVAARSGDMVMATLAGAVIGGCVVLGRFAPIVVAREVAAAYRAAELCCTPSGLAGRMKHAMGDCREDADRG